MAICSNFEKGIYLQTFQRVRVHMSPVLWVYSSFDWQNLFLWHEIIIINIRWSQRMKRNWPVGCRRNLSDFRKENTYILTYICITHLISLLYFNIFFLSWISKWYFYMKKKSKETFLRKNKTKKLANIFLFKINAYT